MYGTPGGTEEKLLSVAWFPVLRVGIGAGDLLQF